MDWATATVSLLLGQGSALLGLWLRLSWRIQHEYAQRRYLAASVEAVAHGGRLQIDEHGSDGRRLRMELTCSQARTKEGKA
ncbi:hypothetical protein [Streptomyces sp. NPDC016845]|uniref:hypothetical protein n=1 Tax=Streptomyces sp. NPDC016845 TaxID=3364972 RepID=UPI0037915CCC